MATRTTRSQTVPGQQTRQRLLLATSGCIGGGMVDAVGLAQSTVTKHRRSFRASGVITGEIAGPRMCYPLNPETLSLLACFAASVIAPDTDARCIPDLKAAT